MTDAPWTNEFPASITVCDEHGTILSMNTAAAATFAADGGTALIGTNLLDCHPEPAKTRVQELLRAGSTNVYTIEKAGIKKLIYQSPWYKNGRYAGLVELSLPIPTEMPHFVRESR